MTHASIEGLVRQVERRGKGLYCFEGLNLRKTGRGELVRVDVGPLRYTGELVAIGPTRAIVFISGSLATHSVEPIAAVAVAQ